MPQPLRLLAVLADPDGETLGVGGSLARCAEEGAAVWGTQTLCRAFSIVNGGSAVETDAFEGLR